MRDPFKILFTFLSLAFYLHHAEDWDAPWFTALAGCFALAIFFVKDWRWAWALYSLSTLPLFIANFPTMANHSNFLFFLGVWFVYYFWRYRESAHPAYVSRTMVYSVAAVYFLAGFHKLNSDFFDTSVSCANDMLARYVDEVGLFSTDFTQWKSLPYLAIALELAVPLFLLFRKTFPLALTGAFLLHGFLAPIGFIDFGSIAFAVLIFHCFASDYLSEASKSRVWTVAKGYFFLQLVLGGMIYFVLEGAAHDPVYWTQATLLILFFAFLVFEVVRAKQWNADYSASFAKGPVIALLLFGSFSYLGLSTAGNFSMFSNLRTEGPFWNHLIVPKFVQIFSYQKDIHWVQGIDRDFHLSGGRHPEVGYAMPRLEFYRLYEQWKDEKEFPETFRLYKDDNWVREEVQSAFDRMPVDSNPFSRLELKFLYFRKIQPMGPNLCRW